MLTEHIEENVVYSKSKYDTPRIVEHIWWSGDSRKITNMVEVLAKYGLMFSTIVDDINKDRHNKDLLSWSYR